MRGLASPHPILGAMCGLSAVAVHQHRRRHPFRAANADPHGPDYSADYRVSTVAVRFRCLMSLLCWSCCVPLGCCMPKSSTFWPVWTKRTVIVACTILVMLVAMHLALFFVPVCRPMLLGIMAYGPNDCGSGMCKAGSAGYVPLLWLLTHPSLRSGWSPWPRP